MLAAILPGPRSCPGRDPARAAILLAAMLLAAAVDAAFMLLTTYDKFGWS